jgi:outer membrane protein, heavy metal efflux system
VSLPLPFWDRRAGAVAAADADAARLSAEVEAERRQTITEVRNAFAAQQTLSSQLAAVREQLGAHSLKARQAADASYAEGDISLLEWLDSVRAYFEAETTYVNLWSEYVARRAALERATATTLF